MTGRSIGFDAPSEDPHAVYPFAASGPLAGFDAPPVLRFSVDGAAVAEAPQASAGAWTFTVRVGTPGSHALRVEATDGAEAAEVALAFLPKQHRTMYDPTGST